MAEVALEAIGDGPGPGAPPGTLWSFPDVETQELAGRIFGDLRNERDATKFYVIKSKSIIRQS